MKLLLTADIHLGRSSTGLPPSVSHRGLALSCREAWERIVDLAVREEVEAVLIAGDLVEESRAYYASLGLLVDSFERLGNAGIQLFAVGGNHDARAFERIAKECEGMEGVHFLGRRGQWQRVPLVIDGEARLRIDGWSFPDHQYPSDPTDSNELERDAGLPVVGLIHADLDSAGSSYAPTTSTALRNLPPNFWLLGHIHKARRNDREGEATILYPGSPQAMDFGETGWHGAWVLEIRNGQMELSQHQVSTVRFEDNLSVELQADDDEEAVTAALQRAADKHIATLGRTERGDLECIVHRAVLRGEWNQGASVDDLQARLPEFDLPERDGLKACFHGRLDDQTALPLDLKQLRSRGGAVGQLAQRLIDLELDAWKNADWFEALSKKLARDYETCRIEGDDEIRDDGTALFGPPTPEDVRAGLARQARHLLVTLGKEDS